MSLTESTVEDAALTWFGELGYTIGHGPELAAGEPAAERDSFGDVVLVERLREAIERLNPGIPPEAREEALRKLLRTEAPGLVPSNLRFHRFLRDGIDVEFRRQDGSLAGDRVRLVDFERPAGNDWFAVNQFAVVEDGRNRRPDIVVFLNGLPLAVLELKVPEEGEEWFDRAYKQVQTYKEEIPSLLAFNELLILSDGLQARIGSLTAGKEWFKVWRATDGHSPVAGTQIQLETLIRGVFDRARLLSLLRAFIVFEQDEDNGQWEKLVAGYHQFHAVHVAVQETIRASREGAPIKEGAFWAEGQPGGKPGDRRAGVVWHTQGSGKSLSMLFYARQIILHPEMNNPTLVVLTDRNDLDDQLFGQFLRCHEHLNQMPVQADSREDLRKLLTVASGGVVFTTIQKFMPEKGQKMTALSRRRNIVVIADEAHRSQYDFIDGLARNLRDEPTVLGEERAPHQSRRLDHRLTFVAAALQDSACGPESCPDAVLGNEHSVSPGLNRDVDRA